MILARSTVWKQYAPYIRSPVRISRPHNIGCSRFYSEKPSNPPTIGSRNAGVDPLRILFCGSDNFSIASLDALHDAAKQDCGFIQSIDVVCRPGKWTGPYKKVFKEVPIAERARSLELPLHQIDTFRGWSPPNESQINLIVAVSFGLLIPRRLIEGAKYGGLNVHPSMLPDLYGAAPLQHALLDNDEHIGVSVQTLHPTKMDEGIVLSQTPNPGLTVPNRARESFASLTEHIAPIGADMLLQTLRDRKFLNPSFDLGGNRQRLLARDQKLRHARKLNIEDKHIDWTLWPADKMIRYQRLLKSLWNTIETPSKSLKIVWSSEFHVTDTTKHGEAVPPGMAYASDDNSSILINTVDGKTLRVDECTVAGDKKASAIRVAQKYDLFNNGDSYRKFVSPFS